MSLPTTAKLQPISPACLAVVVVVPQNRTILAKGRPGATFWTTMRLVAEAKGRSPLPRPPLTTSQPWRFACPLGMGGAHGVLCVLPLVEALRRRRRLPMTMAMAMAVLLV